MTKQLKLQELQLPARFQSTQLTIFDNTLENTLYLMGKKYARLCKQKVEYITIVEVHGEVHLPQPLTNYELKHLPQSC